jgi:hypothetical protein
MIDDNVEFDDSEFDLKFNIITKQDIISAIA